MVQHGTMSPLLESPTPARSSGSVLHHNITHEAQGSLTSVESTGGVVSESSQVPTMGLIEGHADRMRIQYTRKRQHADVNQDPGQSIRDLQLPNKDAVYKSKYEFYKEEIS